MNRYERSGGGRGVRLYSWMFGVGDIYNMVSGCFEGVDERAVREVLYLQWWMVRGVMRSGGWGSVELPGIGVMGLHKRAMKRYRVKMDVKGRRVPMVERDEFLTDPYELRRVKREKFGIVIRKVDNKKIFRRRHELGIRHYVLEC